MKILAIRGKNLASLEGEYAIDFTQEPLLSTGLFAITGPTGAGKSTLLDTLCLALFDDLPRLSQAETAVSVPDVKDKRIGQKDCRNILRRGTGEGYAEVDFVALTGERYRSRWTVRRGRGKAFEALQNVFMKVENLSSGQEEQGTKKELLHRITELIGLTFDQFTRAVLLAQGDFATFLKAKQNEKAELLEKLTGTDIYSRISTIIYRRATDAREALERLQIQIADIKLLNEEELAALNEEQTKLLAEIDPLKQLKQSLQKKIEWIDQERLFHREIEREEATLKAAEEALREASPRYDYISRVDAVQEIRDCYTEHVSKTAENRRLTASLTENREGLVRTTAQAAKASETLEELVKIAEKLNSDYGQLQPLITEARKLDVQIQAQQEKSEGLIKEQEKKEKQIKNIGKELRLLEQKREQTQQQLTALRQWFADNAAYKEIIPRYDWIISSLTDAKQARDQEKNTLQALENGRLFLQTLNERIAKWTQEFERLNELLPTEVLHLRQKLTEGEPCPVCGSLEHPARLHANPDSRYNEEELEKEKLRVQKELEKLRQLVDETTKSNTVFETNSQNYRQRYTDAIQSMSDYLALLPDWEREFEQQQLGKRLKTLYDTWTRNNKELTQNEQQMEQMLLQMELKRASLTELTEEQRLKEQESEQQKQALQSMKTQRAALLENQPASEVENRYKAEIKQQNDRLQLLRQRKEKSDKEKATIAGVIEQLEKELQVNGVRVEELHRQLLDWCSREDHPVAMEQLSELISRSAAWIAREKGALAELKEKVLVGRTTLGEKRNRMESHQQSPNMPKEEESRELLTTQLQAGEEREAAIHTRQTEIGAALLNHAQGKERIERVLQEIKKKRQVFEDWEKLNLLLGSAKGDRFKTIAQGYTLDVLLSYANKHLEELTGRYQLEKIPDTLALQVVDNDMLGEVRTVHSLSGGESFLISLSLALGLSALSSNRMKIESLFIDEGFGALDVDTLSVAMDALDRLQTQGRKIGVISHVEEMKERIGVQIQVQKSSNGKSSIRIVG